MSKSSEINLVQEQMKIKPQVEELIPMLLDGELKDTALEFITYLRDKKRIPRYSSFNSWKVSYKGECVCYIKLSNKMEKNIWGIAFRFEKFNSEFSGGFKKAVQDNMKPCETCLKACTKGIKLTVFEKEITNICRGWPIKFVNPDANTLEYVKELIEYREKLISTNTLPPPFWWNYNPPI